MSLPKVVYIYEEKDREGNVYLIASRDSHEQSEGLVGVYALQEKLYVRTKPQFKKFGTKKWFDK